MFIFYAIYVIISLWVKPGCTQELFLVLCSWISFGGVLGTKFAYKVKLIHSVQLIQPLNFYILGLIKLCVEIT